MPQLFNRVGVASATAGTGTITLGSALGAVAINSSSWLSFSGAGIPDPTIVSYIILDSNGAWEAGTGTFTAGTLSRTVKASSNSNALVNLSGSEQVFVTALACDGGDVLGGTTNPLRGFDAPVNLSLTASTDGTILTVNAVGNNGSNPSPTNPVFIPFRDPTSSNGNPVWRLVTSALSITTNSAGASLGTTASKAFRFWVVAFDNGGTVALGLINCSTASQVFPLNESAVQTSVNMSGTATSAGVFYTTGTITSKSFRIIGFVEYSATGLATPGTYTRVPDIMQLMGPGMPLPGAMLQTKIATDNTIATAVSTTRVQTSTTVSITPTSAANLVRVAVSGMLSSQTAGVTAVAQLSRGTAPTMIGSLIVCDVSGATCDFPCSLIALDAPNTASAQAYFVYINGGAAGTYNWNRANLSTSLIEAWEIMG